MENQIRFSTPKTQTARLAFAPESSRPRFPTSMPRPVATSDIDALLDKLEAQCAQADALMHAIATSPLDISVYADEPTNQSVIYIRAPRAQVALEFWTTRRARTSAEAYAAIMHELRTIPERELACLSQHLTAEELVDSMLESLTSPCFFPNFRISN